MKLVKLLCTPPFSEHLVGCFSHVSDEKTINQELELILSLFSELILQSSHYFRFSYLHQKYEWCFKRSEGWKLFIGLQYSSCVDSLLPILEHWLTDFLILAYYSYYQPMKFMNTVNCGERNSRMLEHSLAEMIINISESFFNLRSKINQV